MVRYAVLTDPIDYTDNPANERHARPVKRHSSSERFLARKVTASEHTVDHDRASGIRPIFI